MTQNNRQELNLPQFNLKIKPHNNKEQIFDIIRKKYIINTPEEWVRQNLVHYLIKILKYPAHLIGIEKKITVFNTNKRPDIIIFTPTLNPLVIAECKKPQQQLNHNTLAQTINYYTKLKPKYLLLSNGIKHHFCTIKNKKCLFLNKIPTYNELLENKF